MAHNLTGRLGGQAARRDDARVARRLSRKPGGAGVSRLDAGAVLDDGCAFLPALGGVDWLESVPGTAVQRARGPVVP